MSFSENSKGIIRKPSLSITCEIENDLYSMDKDKSKRPFHINKIIKNYELFESQKKLDIKFNDNLEEDIIVLPYKESNGKSEKNIDRIFSLKSLIKSFPKKKYNIQVFLIETNYFTYQSNKKKSMLSRTFNALIIKLADTLHNNKSNRKLFINSTPIEIEDNNYIRVQLQLNSNIVSFFIIKISIKQESHNTEKYFDNNNNIINEKKPLVSYEKKKNNENYNNIINNERNLSITRYNSNNNKEIYYMSLLFINRTQKQYSKRNQSDNNLTNKRKKTEDNNLTNKRKQTEGNNLTNKRKKTEESYFDQLKKFKYNGMLNYNYKALLERDIENKSIRFKDPLEYPIYLYRIDLSNIYDINKITFENLLKILLQINEHRSHSYIFENIEIKNYKLLNIFYCDNLYLCCYENGFLCYIGKYKQESSNSYIVSTKCGIISNYNIKSDKTKIYEENLEREIHSINKGKFIE